jgi:hypothetical protein
MGCWHGARSRKSEEAHHDTHLRFAALAGAAGVHCALCARTARSGRLRALHLHAGADLHARVLRHQHPHRLHQPDLHGRGGVLRHRRLRQRHSHDALRRAAGAVDAHRGGHCHGGGRAAGAAGAAAGRGVPGHRDAGLRDDLGGNRQVGAASSRAARTAWARPGPRCSALRSTSGPTTCSWRWCWARRCGWRATCRRAISGAASWR